MSALASLSSIKQMSAPKKILLDSTHFNEIRGSVHARTVAWDALVRSSEISEADATIAKHLESSLLAIQQTSGPSSAASSVRTATPSSQALDHITSTEVESLLNLLRLSDNVDCVKAASNLISELLSSDISTLALDTISYFAENPAELETLFDLSFKPQFDNQTILISSFNMVSLLVQPSIEAPNLVQRLITNEKFISIFNNTQQMDTCYVFVRLLGELCTVRKYRKLVWANETLFLPTIFRIISGSRPGTVANTNTNPAAATTAGGMDTAEHVVIVNTNANNLGIQLQYYSLLLVWLLTFDAKIANEMTIKYLNEFLNLLKLVKVTIKQKVSRVSIAILLQCCSKEVRGHKTFIKNLILLGNGIPTLDSLSGRKYSDEELREDIMALKGILEEEYEALTSFDEYAAELNSKLLCWSPPHIDNGFWTDNIDKFKSNNWKIFKQLISLLIEFKKKNEVDNGSRTTLQILLNDITHVIDYLPESVAVLNQMNGKVVIMELMNNSDSRVKYEALKATQAIIGYKMK